MNNSSHQSQTAASQNDAPPISSSQSPTPPYQPNPTIVHRPAYTRGPYNKRQLQVADSDDQRIVRRRIDMTANGANSLANNFQSEYVVAEIDKHVIDLSDAPLKDSNCFVLKISIPNGSTRTFSKSEIYRHFQPDCIKLLVSEAASWQVQNMRQTFYILVQLFVKVSI